MHVCVPAATLPFPCPSLVSSCSARLSVCLSVCLSARVPKGLEDVSKYPALFAELIRRGYSDDEVVKVARLNLIRVFQDVEEVRMELV